MTAQLNAWQGNFREQCRVARSELDATVNHHLESLDAYASAENRSPNAAVALDGVLALPVTATALPSMLRVGRMTSGDSVVLPLHLPLDASATVVLANTTAAAVLEIALLRLLLSSPPLGCRITILGDHEHSNFRPAFERLPVRLLRRLPPQSSREVEEFLQRQPSKVVVDQTVHVLCVPDFPGALGMRESTLVLGWAQAAPACRRITLLGIDPARMGDDSPRALHGLGVRLASFPTLHDDALRFGQIRVPQCDSGRFECDCLDDDVLQRHIDTVCASAQELLNGRIQAAGVWIGVERLSDVALRARIEQALLAHPVKEHYFVVQRTEPIKSDMGVVALDLTIVQAGLAAYEELTQRFTVATLQINHGVDDSLQEDVMLRLEPHGLPGLALLLSLGTLAKRFTLELSLAVRVVPTLDANEQHISEKIQHFQDANNLQVQRHIDIGRTCVMGALERILSAPTRTRLDRELI